MTTITRKPQQVNPPEQDPMVADFIDRLLRQQARSRAASKMFAALKREGKDDDEAAAIVDACFYRGA